MEFENWVAEQDNFLLFCPAKVALLMFSAQQADHNIIGWSFDFTSKEFRPKTKYKMIAGECSAISAIDGVAKFKHRPNCND